MMNDKMEKSRKMLTGIVALAGLANAGCLVSDARINPLSGNTYKPNKDESLNSVVEVIGYDSANGVKFYGVVENE